MDKYFFLRFWDSFYFLTFFEKLLPKNFKNFKCRFDPLKITFSKFWKNWTIEDIVSYNLKKIMKKKIQPLPRNKQTVWVCPNLPYFTLYTKSFKNNPKCQKKTKIARFYYINVKIPINIAKNFLFTLFLLVVTMASDDGINGLKVRISIYRNAYL